MVGSEDPKHIASKVSLDVLPQLGLLVLISSPVFKLHYVRRVLALDCYFFLV
jgi:hypothetical protein